MTERVEDYCGDCGDCGVYGSLPLRHDEDCPRYRPPRRGPGSTQAHRAAVLAQIRATLADTRRRHQEHP